jgi:structural maintenance of chromosome 1
MTQCKQMKEQKEEAEKHLRMQEDLRTLRTEHVVFKLFHLVGRCMLTLSNPR